MYHNHGKNSSKLAEVILQIIEEGGPITFYRFMEMALYHPQYGYYVRQPFPIGSRGDFITSPHASPIFGGAIAHQLHEMWEIMGGGPFDVVEIGAGSGLLAKDILNYISKFFPDFYDSLTFKIVEPIHSLSRIQKEALRGFNVVWCDDLASIGTIYGCLYSNELLDAFPVHLVRRDAGGFKEVYVKKGEYGGFEECLGPILDDELMAYCQRHLSHLEDGYTTEVDLDIKDWLKQICRVLKKGFLLTIDYGFSRSEYFHPNRKRGTLLSYKGHQVDEDVLDDPGSKDITHHVNFSDLVEWGIDLGLEPIGYCNQWSYLASIGVEEVLSGLFPRGLDPFSPALAGIKMLLLPQGMGDTHKFLIQAKGLGKGVILSGFKLQNRIKRLLK